VEKLAGSCDLTGGNEAALDAQVSMMRASLGDLSVTGASRGAWTWKDWEATLMPEVCSRLNGCRRAG
jgi:hypothetical protein